MRYEYRTLYQQYIYFLVHEVENTIQGDIQVLKLFQLLHYINSVLISCKMYHTITNCPHFNHVYIFNINEFLAKTFVTSIKQRWEVQLFLSQVSPSPIRHQHVCQPSPVLNATVAAEPLNSLTNFLSISREITKFISVILNGCCEIYFNTMAFSQKITIILNLLYIYLRFVQYCTFNSASTS